MAPKPGLEVDEEATRFFGRSSGEAEAVRPPQPPGPPMDELDTVIDDYDDFDGYESAYDATTAFEPMSDLDSEPTPALLAAKAEPLGGGAPSPRAGRKPPKSGRSKASEAARASKARASTRRKPKEPSKLLLAIGLCLVLLAGFATAYLLTRGGDDTGTEAGSDSSETSDVASDTTVADGEVTGSDSTEAAPSGPGTGQPAVVIFDEAAVGPIDAGTPYNLEVGGGPGSATYQLLVDGEPQAEPAAELPTAVFTAGRHLLVINIASPEGDVSTDPVLVYAVGETPASTWRANLSSVDIAGEGWAEAVRQFDEYVAAGHADLQLMPSDRFVGLAPGYWNLFVGGFADQQAARAYCDANGMAVPNECFPKLADPNAPPASE